MILIITFGSYHLMLASESTFMTDSLYLVTMQIWQNLNKHYYYLSSIKSVICQIDASCFQVASQIASLSHQFRTLKTNLLWFNIKFSKNHF